MLGVSRARVSQVVRLARLAVGTQEGILTGNNLSSERGLRDQSHAGNESHESSSGVGSVPQAAEGAAGFDPRLKR